MRVESENNAYVATARLASKATTNKTEARDEDMNAREEILSVKQNDEEKDKKVDGKKDEKDKEKEEETIGV